MKTKLLLGLIITGIVLVSGCVQQVEDLNDNMAVKSGILDVKLVGSVKTGAEIEAGYPRNCPEQFYLVDDTGYIQLQILEELDEGREHVTFFADEKYLGKLVEVVGKYRFPACEALCICDPHIVVESIEILDTIITGPSSRGKEILVEPVIDYYPLGGYAKERNEAFYVLHGDIDQVKLQLKEIVTTDKGTRTGFGKEETLNLVIFRGVFNTGGYGIEMDSVEAVGNVFNVYATYTNPGPGMDVTTAFTQPTAIVPIGNLSVGKYQARLIVTSILKTGEGDKISEKEKEHLSIWFKVENQVERQYEIQLKSRYFVPEPGISEDTKLKLESMNLERVHVFMQFFQSPNATEKEILKRKGVELLGYIPQNTQFASVNTNDLEDVATLHFVRSVALVLPEDKIAYWIKSGVSPHATNDDGTVNLTVLFFEDVELEEAERIIQKHGGTAVGVDVSLFGVGVFHSLGVVISEDAIPHLASEDRVQWIEEVPGPPTTDV